MFEAKLAEPGGPQKHPVEQNPRHKPYKFKHVCAEGLAAQDPFNLAHVKQIWPQKCEALGFKNARIRWGLGSSGHQVGSWIAAGISYLACKPQELNTTRNWALGCLALSLGWAWDGLGVDLGGCWDGLEMSNF